MRLAAMIVCSATVPFLVACASATTSTHEEDSASEVEIPEGEYGEGYSHWRASRKHENSRSPVPDERKDGADGQDGGGSGV
jgi:hypothetical protein